MTNAVAASTRAPAFVPAVVRALAVMDLLAQERRPMSMAAVASALALPRSSVHGLCSTLVSSGYLRRVSDGSMQIGPGVMKLADAFVASTNVAGEFDALWRDAPPSSDETVVLSVLSGTEVVYVGVRNSVRPLGLAFNIGMRLPASQAATGKAMLAWLPADDVRSRYGDAPLPRAPGRRAVGVNTLLKELAETRRRGWALDDGEVREGVVSIAAPVFDAAGQPVAGLGVCVNRAVMNEGEHERQRRFVIDSAIALSRRLGARGSTS